MSLRGATEPHCPSVAAGPCWVGSRARSLVLAPEHLLAQSEGFQPRFFSAFHRFEDSPAAVWTQRSDLREPTRSQVLWRCFFPKTIFSIFLHALQTKILNRNKVCLLAGLQCPEIKSNYTLRKMHLGYQIFFQKIPLRDFLLGKGALFVSLPSLEGEFFATKKWIYPRKWGREVLKLLCSAGSMMLGHKGAPWPPALLQHWVVNPHHCPSTTVPLLYTHVRC